MIRTLEEWAHLVKNFQDWSGMTRTGHLYNLCIILRTFAHILCLFLKYFHFLSVPFQNNTKEELLNLVYLCSALVSRLNCLKHITSIKT